jgi:hypothetical protein
MTAELRGPTRVPEVDEGIKLRTLRHGEEAEFVQSVNEGFGWERLELGDLERWKAEDPPFDEKWVKVAEAAGKIVSVVVAKPDTDYNKYLHTRMGYLGPATTLPEFRNKHLASALTARAMNLLFEKGMNKVRLGTSEKRVFHRSADKPRLSRRKRQKDPAQKTEGKLTANKKGDFARPTVLLLWRVICKRLRSSFCAG